MLNHGARIDITDALGSTPLSMAASMGHLETFRGLLKRGASVDIAENEGSTALGVHEEIVRELQNHGAEADITDAFGSTPHSAAA